MQRLHAVSGRLRNIAFFLVMFLAAAPLHAEAAADFEVLVSPASQVIPVGGSATYTVQVNSLAGYSSPVSLSLSSPNADITGSFAPVTLTPPADGSVSSTLTVNTSAATALGNYSLNVLATDGVITHIAPADLEVAAVDLIMSSVSTTSTSVSTGGQLVLSNTVTNQGGLATSVATYVGLYLSTDNVITTSDIYIGSRTIYGLAAGASSSQDNTVTVPATLAGGTYYVGAIADFTNTQDESNETNNALAGGSIEVIRDIDLVVSSVSTTSTSVSTGGQLVLSNTVTNQGSSATSVATYVGLYLSTDNVITTSDIYVGSRTIYGLAAGASSSQDNTVTVPATLAGGTYYVGAIADFTNTQDESNETNNALAGGSIEVIRDIDLVVSSVSTTASSVLPGDQFVISNTVVNQGSSSTSTSTYVGLYLSTDNVITTSDTYIGSRTIYGLAAGASSSADTTVTFPATLPEGRYYIGAIADFTNAQDESNETNNALAGNVINDTLTGAVDLVVTSASINVTGPVTHGQAIEVTVTVENQGTKAMGVDNPWQPGFSIGLDMGRDAIPLGLRYTDAWHFNGGVNLAPGESYTNTFTYYVPYQWWLDGAGTYYLSVYADIWNHHLESNENNNEYVITSTPLELVFEKDEDLVMTEVSTLQGNIAAGDTITVRNTVTNQGSSPSQGFWVLLSLTDAVGNEYTGINLGRRWVPGLAAGASNTEESVFDVPYFVAAGDYHLTAVADAAIWDANYHDGQLYALLNDELYEDNNKFTNPTPIAITPAVKSGPDLVVTDFAIVGDPATLKIGDAFAYTLTVQNQGDMTATSTSRYWGWGTIDVDISLYDANGSWDWVGRNSLPSLAPGESYTLTGSASAKVCCGTPFVPGPGKAFVTLDWNNHIQEYDETNNSQEVPIEFVLDEGADFVISSISVDKAIIAVGEQYAVDFTVTNQGTSKAWGSWAALQLVDDTTGGAIYFGELWVPYLGPGESMNERFVFKMGADPYANLTPGTYHFEAIANRFDLQPESDTTNNTLSSAPFEVLPSDIDLALSNVTLEAPTVPAGGWVAVNVDVTNLGTTPEPGIIPTITFYLSTDGVARDYYLKAEGRPPRWLAPNQTESTQFKVNPHTRVPPGVYQVMAVLSTELDGNAANNTAVSVGTLEVFRDLDLAISEPLASGTPVAAGSSFTIIDTLSNMSNIVTHKPSYILYYLTEDPWDPSAINYSIYYRYPPYDLQLSPGVDYTADTTFDVLLYVPAGFYYVVSEIPDDGEDNLANNVGISATPIEVYIDLDLAMTELSTTQTSVNVGDSLTVLNTVSNLASIVTAPRVQIAFYLKPDPADPVSSGTWMGTRYVGQLAPGAASNDTTVLTVPTVPPGTYYLSAYATDSDTLNETDLSNNEMVYLVPIQVF